MRRVKRILSYVLVLCMCFTLFFMPKYTVYAEESTYTVYDANTCITYQILPNGNPYNPYFNASFSYSGRIVQIKADNLVYTYVFMPVDSNITQFQYYMNTSNTAPSSCGVNRNLTQYIDYNNQRYLYYRNSNGYDSNGTYISNLVVDTNANERNAIKYAYGDEAVDPAPPGPSWGKPYDVEYATRIAGSGLASADNIDRIVWNRAVDTNGNELPTGARVQIRAIPGKYVGNTANDVLTKSYTDFILDHSKQLIIVDIIASRGVYETKWSEVVDHFGFFPYSWVPNIQYIDNEYFKMGWIYQIRLQVDDYYSDWTNIYTATGSGASESQTITDSDEISQQLVQDINIVNQLNNTSNVNWYINETTINNSEYTENTNGKPWWAYLLEAILSLLQIGDGEQQTINNTNNLNIDLNDKLNEYNEIEDQQLNNLDTNLEAIEVESDMLENNKFVGSANWVAQQYTRITNGTVIGSLIGFSLLFGLALIFIGKIR